MSVPVGADRPEGSAPGAGDRSAGASVLSVRHIAAGYGDLRVVWDVSFDVHAGRVTSVLGRNGAGKTTTLRTVAGLNRAMAGTILLDDEPVTEVRAFRRTRRGIGFVQENKRVFRRRTVEDNLLLGGYSTGLGRARLRAAAGEVYDLFPVLRDRARAAAGELSGGQQQMLAIGQALMGRPRLLMLDEPSAGLAPSVVSEVMEAVQRLKASGLGILLVEQAVEAAMSVSDHVVVLDIGRVVLSGAAADIDDLTVIRDAYFGRPPAAT
ncbi:MAG TPA: ABC transporter ATP-binding protein [Acidimicrobiales bacterium]|nr:ABC transporter ATP-binding protein [Acidimicrobiales bacterium]